MVRRGLRLLAATVFAMTVAALTPAGAARAATYDIYGGEQYRLAGGAYRCTVALAVTTGYVSGACGPVGALTYGTNGVEQGTVVSVGTQAQGNLSYIRHREPWVPRGYVRSGSALLAVRGATEAPVGAQVCRHAAGLAVRCGVVQGRNLTLTFAGGQQVHGVTRASLCVEPGSSSGPLMAGDQAQGIVLVASGTCTAGGSVYYLPLHRLLTAQGLRLVTVR